MLATAASSNGILSVIELAKRDVKPLSFSLGQNQSVVDILFGDHVVKAHRLGKLEFGFRPNDFERIEKYLNSSNQGEMKIKD